MADTTYPLAGQGNYQQQGAKQWTVGSTGTLTIEGGGTLALNDGATFNMQGDLTVGTSATLTMSTGGTGSISGVATFNSTAVINLLDGSELALPVTVQATSTGAITNFGVTTFGSTSADTYTLAAPDYAGLTKILICTVHGATTISSAITTATTNSYIRNSTAVAGDTHTLTFLSAGRFAELISVSTSEWRLLSRSAADVALT